jgi:hypothetical protein
MRKENAKFSDAVDDTESSEVGGFLRRWSSRKRRARREGKESDEISAVTPAEESKAVDADESAEPERVLTDEDMPPIESLNEDSDYSGFLSPGVSESLRKLALRKMFLSSKFNVTDGLDDYAEDFTSFAPLGDIVTSDMRHRMEMEAQRMKEKLEEESRAAMEGVPEGEGDEAGSASRQADDGDTGEQQDEIAASGDSKAGESKDGTSTGGDFGGG